MKLLEMQIDYLESQYEKVTKVPIKGKCPKCGSFDLQLYVLKSVERFFVDKLEKVARSVTGVSLASGVTSGLKVGAEAGVALGTPLGPAGWYVCGVIGAILGSAIGGYSSYKIANYLNKILCNAAIKPYFESAQAYFLCKSCGSSFKPE